MSLTAQTGADATRLAMKPEDVAAAWL